MQERHAGASLHLVNKLAFPEKHGILLVLGGLLALGGEELSGLLLLDLVNFSEGSTSEFLDDLETTIEDFLIRG